MKLQYKLCKQTNIGRNAVPKNQTWGELIVNANALIMHSFSSNSTGLPRSGKKFWKIKKIPGQG